MQRDSSLLEVSIQGQRIPLRAREDDSVRAQEVIELVSQHIREAEKRSRPNAAPHQVALLALLDMAEEHLTMREKTRLFKRAMSEKSERLIGLLEAELK